MFTLALEEIGNAFLLVAGVQFRRLVFGTCLAAAQVVQTNVGNDAIQPGIEAAFETETVEIAVNLEERFLVDVPGVFGALHQIERQPQHVTVVAAHQFLESRAAAGLCYRDQGPLIEVGQ